jgi:hypothetical protein
VGERIVTGGVTAFTQSNGPVGGLVNKGMNRSSVG